MRQEQRDYAPYWEKAFVEGLKRERAAQGMTQADLAERMSDLGFRFDQATVYKIENGKRKVTAAEAWGLAEILDVDLQYLYNWQVAHGSPEALRKLIHTQADSLVQDVLDLDTAAHRLSMTHRAFAETVRRQAQNGLTQETPGAGEVPLVEYYEPLLALSIQNEILWRLRSEIWTREFAELTSKVHGTYALGPADEEEQQPVEMLVGDIDLAPSVRLPGEVTMELAALDELPGVGKQKQA